jgi:hypothetical protein
MYKKLWEDAIARFTYSAVWESDTISRKQILA